MEHGEPPSRVAWTMGVSTSELRSFFPTPHGTWIDMGRRTESARLRRSDCTLKFMREISRFLGSFSKRSWVRGQLVDGKAQQDHHQTNKGEVGITRQWFLCHNKYFGKMEALRLWRSINKDVQFSWKVLKDVNFRVVIIVVSKVLLNWNLHIIYNMETSFSRIHVQSKSKRTSKKTSRSLKFTPVKRVAAASRLLIWTKEWCKE